MEIGCSSFRVITLDLHVPFVFIFIFVSPYKQSCVLHHYPIEGRYACKVDKRSPQNTYMEKHFHGSFDYYSSKLQRILHTL